MNPLHPLSRPGLLVGVRGAAPTAPFGRGLPTPRGGLLSFTTGIREETGQVYFEFSQTYEQGFRVADDSYDLYELYVGEDGPVDFGASGQPVATSPTLPFSWTPTPPGVGTKVLHIVVRKRNKYDLVGFNVYETIKVIDSAAEEELADVSAPIDLNVLDWESGYIRILARYMAIEDPDPADAWEVYAKEGSAPVPGTDTPSTPTMVVLGASAGVQVTAGPFTPGATVHVIVVAKRTSDTNRGVSETVEHVMAEDQSPTNGEMFGGDSYEQR